MLSSPPRAAPTGVNRSHRCHRDPQMEASPQESKSSSEPRLLFRTKAYMRGHIVAVVVYALDELRLEGGQTRIVVGTPASSEITACDGETGDVWRIFDNTTSVFSLLAFK
jgi:hypothetical protein